MQVRSLGWEDPLEKEMATDPSIFAWKTPWTVEPGQAPVHGVTKSQKRLSAHAHTHTHAERVSVVLRDWKRRA